MSLVLETECNTDLSFLKIVARIIKEMIKNASLNIYYIYIYIAIDISSLDIKPCNTLNIHKNYRLKYFLKTEFIKRGLCFFILNINNINPQKLVFLYNSFLKKY